MTLGIIRLFLPHNGSITGLVGVELAFWLFILLSCLKPSAGLCYSGVLAPAVLLAALVLSELSLKLGLSSKLPMAMESNSGSLLGYPDPKLAPVGYLRCLWLALAVYRPMVICHGSRGDWCSSTQEGQWSR